MTDRQRHPGKYKMSPSPKGGRHNHYMSGTSDPFRGMDMLSGEGNSVKILFYYLLKKGSNLKGRNWLPEGANCFLLE